MDANEIVHCGPVALRLTAATPALHVRALEELQQFTARWAEPCPLVRVSLRAAERPAALGEGRFLHCSNLRVDRLPSGLIATCRSGASAVYDAPQRRWEILVRARPPRAIGAEPIEQPWTGDQVEDLLELVLTTAWRAAGWIPLHAGGVVLSPCCALLLASAKGGKSTLTAVMLHRGWRMLGDDKALIALRDGGRPEVRGLTTQLNLDPRTRAWVPELGDLEALPRLSTWSAKRRVMMEDIWAGGFAGRAAPTHVVVIQRSADRRPARVEQIGTTAILSALLRQTVVPADAAIAKGILTTLARSAQTLRGLRFEIGDDAYADPRTVDALEAALA